MLIDLPKVEDSKSFRKKQGVPRTGVLILPPASKDARARIQALTKVSDVFTNYPLSSLSDKFQTHLISTDASVENSADTDPGFDKPNTSAVIGKESGFDLTNRNGQMLAIMLYMLTKANVERLVIATSAHIPAFFVYVALRYLKPEHLRVFVGNHLATDEEIRSAIIAKQDTFEDSYQSLKLYDQDIEVTPDNCLSTPSGATLRPYQQKLVDFVLHKKRVGLFVDMGLGKTLSTLASLDELAKNGQIDTSRPVLIVAPIMVALDTWSREVDKWGYDMDVLINIKQSPKKRQALFEKMIQPHDKLTLVTTNPAQLAPLLKFLNEASMPDLFQVVIVDELSQFKSATTKRFKNLQAISHNSEYFIGLTGTPSPNSLLDVYSELLAIDPENRHYLGDTFYAYRARFFEPDFVTSEGYAFSYHLKPGSEDKIFNIMKRDVVSLKSDGLVDLPSIVYDDKYVTLPAKAQKTYNTFDEAIRKSLANSDDSDIIRTSVNGDSDKAIDVANAAILTSKLQQLSSGAIYSDYVSSDGKPDLGYDDPDKQILAQTMSKTEADASKLIQADPKHRTYTVFHDEKLKMLQDIVENATSPVLVYFYFQSELERMKKYIDFEYLDPHSPDIQDIIKRWNEGKIPVLVAHPASAGHGLNLQDGGHIMVWLTLPWSNEQYRQAIKRLYRSGQKDTVSVIHIIAANTVDEEVIDRLDQKEQGQDKLMTSLNLSNQSAKGGD